MVYKLLGNFTDVTPDLKDENHFVLLQTTKDHLLTFTALIEFLRQPIRFHKFSEIMIARGLIVWLANQKISKSIGVKQEVTTPKGLLQLVAHGTITYSDAYTVLCRYLLHN